jgi:hypothetical protein
MKLVKLLATLGLVLNFGTSYAQEEVAQGQDENAVAPAAVPGKPALESTTSLQKVVPPETPKSWGGSYLNETRYGRADAMNTTGEVELYHRFGVTYKLPGGTIGVFQPWTQNQEVTTSNAKVTANDPFVRFVWNKVSLNHDWTLEPLVRYYIPTSDASTKLGTNGTLRTDMEFKKPLNGRLTFSYAFSGFYNLQKSLSSYKKAADIKNKNTMGKMNVPGDSAAYAYEANAHYKTYNLLGMYYEMNKKWTFFQQVGILNSYTYGDAAHGINHQNEDKALVWSYFNYDLNPKVSLSFGLEQERGSADRNKEPAFTLFADNETNYFASISVGI